MKNVVLGCTHYPLIESEIRNVLGQDITFFNGALRLAIHLKELLKEKELLNSTNKKRMDVKFIDSGNSEEKEERFFKYLKELK